MLQRNKNLQLFNYQLIRSARRKTLLLQVKQGQVFVRAPVYVSLAQIEQFIEQKSCWLKQKIAEHQQPENLLPAFYHDSIVYYLGEQKRLMIRYAPKASLIVDKDLIVVTLTFKQQEKYQCDEQISALVRQQLACFFKEKLQTYLINKLAEFCPKLTLYPTKYKVRFYKRRWGSCNSRGELSFNYLLMMLPCWVIDYVIIHELCHLQHLNHSVNFWALVNKHCAYTEQAKQWLKDNQYKLIWPQ